ncbi:MAG: hypothetical protein ABIJ33_01535 [Patescibacteria group bacterium]
MRNGNLFRSWSARKEIIHQTNQKQVFSIDLLKIQPPATAGDVPPAVIQHVLNNVIESTHISSICVDGGYTPEQAGGELARPGADLGLSMALLSLGFEPQTAFDLVLNFRLSRGQKYGWHTDTHEGRHGVEVGCGHANAAITEGQYYGVTGKDMLDLIQIVRNYQTQNPGQFLYHVLDRQHLEQGVLVIVSHKFTIQPWGKKNEQDQTNQPDQFFVYDQARDKKLMTELQDYLEIHHQVRKLSDLENAVSRQTNATLGLLASSQGKPIYQVGLTNAGDKLQIIQVGFAPTKESLSDSP